VTAYLGAEGEAWYKAQLERNRKYRRMLAERASKALSLSVAAGTKRITLPGDAAPDLTGARKLATLAELDRVRAALDAADVADLAHRLNILE
jgi:phage protein U